MHYNVLVAWRTRDFWMRALLCWTVAVVFFINDEVTSYDLRLKIRGPRSSSAPIVIIDLPEADWASIDAESGNILRPMKEIITVTDAFFWNARIWEKLLSRILDSQPHAVGVSLFFGDNIRASRISARMRELFEDKRVVWGSDVDLSGRILTPVFASPINSNIGLRNLRLDDDGHVRRFSNSKLQTPHMAVRLASLAETDHKIQIEQSFQTPTLINFSGDKRSYRIVNAKDIIQGRIAPDIFINKIIIIGSLDSPLEQMQTPLGRMSRAEIIANITENILLQKSITRLPNMFYFILLALIMAGSIWVLYTYPQSVSLVVFIIAAILWTAISAWAFDRFYFWIPVFTPLAQIMITSLVFLSYQLGQNEKRSWRLEQERLYLDEIEQLKTNFVSMMSHDLKTPIAKIQAICDRLLAAMQSEEMAQDLKTLRKSSDELHRYIQSILQVTKVEAKDFKIQIEPMDINEQIERVVSRIAPLAREKNVSLTSRLEPMFSIEADSTLIQEVVHNLIENAIKYTPANGTISVVSQEIDDKVVVVIEDTGPGIAPEDQVDIWRKFTRGKNQIQAGSEVRGTGLGLYLVRYFIELHGGQVFLESALGRGTRIGFSIPMEPDEGG